MCASPKAADAPANAGDAVAVNAALCEHLTRHAQSTVLSPTFLSALPHYPLPVLTGASASSVAGLEAEASALASLCHTMTAAGEDRLTCAAAAIHSFWHEPTHSRFEPLCENAVPASSGDGRCTRSWLSCSPFRACALPSFHQRLQQLANAPSGSKLNSSVHGGETVPSTPWRMMDGLCHGFTATTAGASSSSARAGTRKRLRTANLGETMRISPPRAERSSGGTVNIADPAALPQRAAVVPSGESMHSSRTTVVTGALQSRIAENDDLLGMLLGVPTADPLRPEADAEEDIAKSTATAVSMATSDADGQASCRPLPTTPLPGYTCGTTRETQPLLERVRSNSGTATQPFCREEAAAAPAHGVQESQNLFSITEKGHSAAELALLTAKVLKDRCVCLGLLSTGPKTVLVQRIALYYAKRKQQTPTGTSVMVASVAPASSTLQQQQQHVAAHSSGGRAATHVTERGSLSPPPSVASQLLSAGGGVTRTASASPPRTVFRYRSPSTPPVQQAGEGDAAVAPASIATPLLDGTASTSRDGLSSRQAAAPVVSTASALPALHCRRQPRVPPPGLFVQQLIAAHQQQQSRHATAPGLSSSSTSRGGLNALMCESAESGRLSDPSSASSSSPTARTRTSARAQEEELKNASSNVRWQWLVDYRERAGGAGRGGGRSKHEGMMDAFRKQQVPCTSVMLPSGDFMLAVELTQEEKAELGWELPLTPRGVRSSANGQMSVERADVPATVSAASVAGEPLLLEHVCSLVVERKTAADLDASVKGSRYSEQRRLLAASPYKLVVWLIEGSEVGSGYGSPSTGAFARYRHTFFSQRSPSPPPPLPLPSSVSALSDTSIASTGTGVTSAASPTSPATPAESARQRVNTACASLGLQHSGWVVVRTRNTMESVQVLKQLAVLVARQLASRRLAKGLDGIAQTASDTCACDAPLFRSLRAAASAGQPHTCTIPALLHFAPTRACLDAVGKLQRHLRAQTAFPRMLMCVRGCSASLASTLTNRYGSLLGFWRELRRRGRDACDADAEVRRLTTAQKKVYVLLTEFLLAKDYY